MELGARLRWSPDSTSQGGRVENPSLLWGRGHCWLYHTSSTARAVSFCQKPRYRTGHSCLALLGAACSLTFCLRCTIRCGTVCCRSSGQAQTCSQAKLLHATRELHSRFCAMHARLDALEKLSRTQEDLVVQEMLQKSPLRPLG